jgi:hypothetical protein
MIEVPAETATRQVRDGEEQQTGDDGEPEDLHPPWRRARVVVDHRQ